MTTRIEIDLKTGKRVSVELTPEEIADAQARTAAELARRKPAPISAEELLAAMLRAGPQAVPTKDEILAARNEK